MKVLLFTEFLPTQEMLLNALAGAGIISVAINGGMSLAERALAQSAFRERARVLVYTDAGGEGINLQFAQSASARFGPVLRAAGGVAASPFSLHACPPLT